MNVRFGSESILQGQPERQEQYLGWVKYSGACREAREHHGSTEAIILYAELDRYQVHLAYIRLLQRARLLRPGYLPHRRRIQTIRQHS